ncbi:MAG: ATP-binding cassette domain-containing protein [Chloroflexi bacterium]|nr:ATP-binding cassette domain-containing protein [Chloroflexota bacterium]
MIEVEHLTKYFGDFIAVEDVSFDVQPGEIVGFLGPNAAGKTTTMRIITGFMPPSEGTVRVAGYDILRNSLEARREI